MFRILTSGMSLIDLILNIACVLLWLKWRDKSHDLLTPKVSLIVTLKKTRPSHRRVWFLMGLLALLLVRSVLYWQLGSALNWNPPIWFGVIPIPFRGDFFGRMMLFSFLSFGVALVYFYHCLLLLSILKSDELKTDPLQNLIREQLGLLDRLPTFVKLLLPWLAMILFWLALSKPLVAIGVLPSPKSWQHLIEQGVVTGASIYLAWKYLIAGFLLFHLLNSYIYFGPGLAWIFIDRTARQILKPLSWLPLRLGRFDFAPLVATALVLVAAHYAMRGLAWVYLRLPL